MPDSNQTATGPIDTPEQPPPGAPEGVTQHLYPVYGDLAGKAVLISGGGSGIGAYLTYAFAAQGCRVAFIALREQSAMTLVQAVEAATGQRPLFLRCDLRDVETLQAKVREAEAQMGGFDVLVNNAARDDRHATADFTVAEWDDNLAVNLRPQFFLAQTVVPGMKRAGGGAIVNLGSTAHNLGLAGYPAYVAAKAGVTGLTRALAREFGPDGIRVNTVVPGWVMTERQQRLWVTPEALAETLAAQCLKRPLSGEDIASAVLFLASRASSMMTGQSLVVDGGRTMG
ncbi:MULTISPECIES: SDR family NAD(P)-dependent oxidoreductase [Nitrospirillum]|uniref:NAD(P)-dependent dehydrogenase (Short-subunit alcohol dehydrogenase family) n=1 Tax=Nitrospirillum amazonense TaxID=28077 RepID=A0A560FXC0_9PROT|nr:SDR family oxidoreductase [Nitrospirillum amazonense]MEC4590424.1 SDR family oxidoreductase [Nitrospirillum amazonense]TWB26285.1 NAD(P)-dependent dehydrogenase (short-subunit alcohol dehydrogenase family) [Nitrospirillum amazonense]